MRARIRRHRAVAQNPAARFQRAASCRPTARPEYRPETLNRPFWLQFRRLEADSRQSPPEKVRLCHSHRSSIHALRISERVVSQADRDQGAALESQARRVTPLPIQALRSARLWSDRMRRLPFRCFETQALRTPQGRRTSFGAFHAQGDECRVPVRACPIRPPRTCRGPVAAAAGPRSIHGRYCSNSPILLLPYAWFPFDSTYTCS